MLRARGCQLVAVALDIGGRWKPEAVHFIRVLSQAPAREVPPAELAWEKFWSPLLSVAAGRSFAATLVHQSSLAPGAQDGPAPDEAWLSIELRK